MNHEASASVDTDSDANVIASFLESLGIEDTADDGDDKSEMIREASGYVDVANNVTTTLQSLDVASDTKERFPVLKPKHKIFLSHSGAQKSFVADLCADLMRRDRYPFFD